MMAEGLESDSDFAQSDSGHRDGKSSHLRWVLIGGGIAIIGLFVASVWWPNLTERTKFFTANLLNLVLGVAVIAQVLIYRKQWHVMERQWHEANRQAKSSAQVIELMVLNECAYVRVGDMEILPIHNHNLVIRGKFFNGGKTPAWNFLRQIQVAVKTEPPGFLGWEASSEESGVSSILANGDINFDTKPLTITDEVLADLNTDKKWIFVDGECRYFDQLGGKLFYTFGYTFELNPPRAIERYQNRYREEANQAKPN